MKRQRLVEWIESKYPKISHSRACRLLSCSRTSKYYKKKMLQKDEFIKQKIESVLGSSKIGREKVIHMIQRGNPEIGSYRIRRVYELYGFSLTKKLRRRIKVNPPNPIAIPTCCNEEWAMDFMSDSLIDGNHIRTFNVIDHYDRSCKGIVVKRSMPSVVVIKELEKMIEIHGKPKKIRTDNGPEFRSNRFQKWLKSNDIEWNPIQKGKPAQNGIVERFNRTYREDILDANIFENTAHIQELTNQWINEYNEVRPHQSLGYLTPSEYAA